MSLDPDTCYRALTSRDARFDGVFYVAVRTTGIYCRPICPVRPPAADRCAYYDHAAAAERDGFRACLRCRPELAPGAAPVDAVPRLVRAATALIDSGYLNDHSVEDLASRLGVSDRHLRRATESVLGVSPVDLAQTRRLALAKRLLQDTDLPITDVAFAAGFSSVRRFNASFAERFARPPSEVRRGGTPGAGVTLRLDYRPPLEWAALLRFLAGRAIPGVEEVHDGTWRRTVRVGSHVGTVAVTQDPKRPALRATVSASLLGVLPFVVSRVRAVFDLDAHPDRVAATLSADPLLAPLVAASPGLRVPGAFDPFETAVRAILGQQVSVRAATTLSGRLVARYGAPTADATLTHTFPDAERLAHVDDLAAIGLPAARARTIVTLAQATLDGRVDFSALDPEATIVALEALPGIGPWTAHYIALRCLAWPDAFPSGDLAIRKALGVTALRVPEERAAAWRPWRAYATLYLWNSLTEGG